jgi:hypothetical protein
MRKKGFGFGEDGASLNPIRCTMTCRQHLDARPPGKRFRHIVPKGKNL